MQNRQSGRRRRSSNNPRPMGMAAAGQGNMSRQEGRVRGNASQLLEKYKVMARDAHQAGDRVAAEYYLQHADHYFRVLNDSRIRQDEMRARRGTFDQMDDEPDEDEAGDEDARGQVERGQAERGRDERSREERQDRRDRGPRDRNVRPRPPVDERGARSERRDRDGYAGSDAGSDADSDRPRVARAGRMSGGREEREERADRMALSDGEAALAAFGGVAGGVAGAAAGDDAPPAPKRRGRPRKVVAQTPEPGGDGDGGAAPAAADS